MSLETQTFTITRADLVRYAAASGDDNPIHQDEAVATSVGLPGAIAHGMYTMALAARAVSGVPRAPRWSASAASSPTRSCARRGRGRARGSRRLKGTEADGLTTVVLTVTCEGVKVLGMPRAVLREAVVRA